MCSFPRMPPRRLVSFQENWCFWRIPCTVKLARPDTGSVVRWIRAFSCRTIVETRSIVLFYSTWMTSWVMVTPLAKVTRVGPVLGDSEDHMQYCGADACHHGSPSSVKLVSSAVARVSSNARFELQWFFVARRSCESCGLCGSWTVPTQLSVSQIECQHVKPTDDRGFCLFL